MIRSGDGGGARRELRSPPTVPAQRGTGGCVPHDCDLTAARVLADGTSCRYCHGVTHAARKDGRDVREPVRLAYRYQCRGDSVCAITARRSLALDLPEFPQFPADRGSAGQLSPIGVRCGIPRLLAAAIRRPSRARCPDPAPLTTTPLTEMYWGCRTWAEPHLAARQPIGHDRAGSCACRHPVWPPWRANPLLRAGRSPGSKQGRPSARPAHARARTSAVHRRRVGHSGRPEIGQE
jgi:hypothetical protein